MGTTASTSMRLLREYDFLWFARVHYIHKINTLNDLTSIDLFIFTHRNNNIDNNIRICFNCLSIFFVLKTTFDS